MSLIRISFLNYLNHLNEDEIQELMGYLTQLTDDYKQDYSKFKETLRSEFDSLKTDDTVLETSCYSFVTCLDDSKISLDGEDDLTKVTKIEFNQQDTLRLLSDSRFTNDSYLDDERPPNIVNSTAKYIDITSATCSDFTLNEFTHSYIEDSKYDESVLSFSTTNLDQTDEFMKNYQEAKNLLVKVRAEHRNFSRDKNDSITSYVYKGKNLITDFAESGVLKWSFSVIDHLFTKEELSMNNLIPNKRSKRGHLSPNRVRLFRDAMIQKFNYDTYESEKTWLFINKKINTKGRNLAQRLSRSTKK